MVIRHPNPIFPETVDFSSCEKKMEKPEELLEITKRAIEIGATEAALIDSDEIRIESELASLCSGNPACENFGKAPSCPPHVGGPDAFIKWRNKSLFTIVIRIDVPSDIMFSEERREVMRLLQETLAVLERAAAEIGFTSSKAFAGGSCKKIWCSDHPDCSVLMETGPCRYPDKARPSMSGFGINVTKLMESAGWTHLRQPATIKSKDPLWIAGLVLLM